MAFIQLTFVLILLNSNIFINGDIFRLEYQSTDDKRFPEIEQGLLKVILYGANNDDAKYIHVNSNQKVIPVSESKIAERSMYEKQLAIFSVFTETEIDGKFFLSNAKGFSSQKDFQILCRDSDGKPTKTELIEPKEPKPNNCLWLTANDAEGKLVYIPLHAFALKQISRDTLEEIYAINRPLPLSLDAEFILVDAQSDSSGSLQWIIINYNAKIVNFQLNSLWQLNFEWMGYKADGRNDQRRGMWRSYKPTKVEGMYIITNANDWEYWPKPGEKEDSADAKANTMMLCNKSEFGEYYIAKKPEIRNEDLEYSKLPYCCWWNKDVQSGTYSAILDCL